MDGHAASSRRSLGKVALLGVAHALVDAGSAFLLFRDLDPATAAPLILLYDVLAFAGQVPLGALADRFRAARLCAGAGVVLVGAALVLPWPWPLAGVVAVAIGNALFHVGAGAEVLRRSAARAAEGGLFVGPGAVGLFAGIALGSGRLDARAALVLLLAAALPAVAHAVRWGPPADLGDAPRPPAAGRAAGPWLALAALALLGSVAVRAIAGGVANAACRAQGPALLGGLALAACAGKVAGGFVADRLGWRAASAAALVLAAPLLGPLLGHGTAALLGMLLLQSTMPVTLKAVHLLLPERPGLAFGLPCLAIAVGVLVTAAPWPWLSWLRSGGGQAGLLLASAALVLAGLGWGARARGAPLRQLPAEDLPDEQPDAA